MDRRNASSGMTSRNTSTTTTSMSPMTDERTPQHPSRYDTGRRRSSTTNVGARASASNAAYRPPVEQPHLIDHQSQLTLDNNNEAYDMNGTHFNADMFIQRITREYSIDHLMKTEKNLILQIQHLDSDMQTLVYENYNKFILATDTIRNMKRDFKEMEDKMGLLAGNIVKITENSSKISESLQEKRDKVARLSGIHELLKKLKFLFELPNKLNQHCEDGNYEEAVRCYLSGVQFVNEFKRFPSLEAIKQDCQHIVAKIRDDLYKDFHDEEKSSQDLTRNVTLLLNLGEGSSKLGDTFLQNAFPKLLQNLDSLKAASSPNVSLEEFMELGCGIFLSNLSLVIASYSQAFIKADELKEQLRLECQEMLKPYVQNLMDKFLQVMEERLIYEVRESCQQEAEYRDEILKAMDRLYRRLMAMGTLMPNTDFTDSGQNLITALAKLDSELCLDKVKTSFEKAVADSGSELKCHPGSAQEILGSILSTFVVQLKSSLSKLQDYCRSEFHFAQNPDFRLRVGVVIAREGLIVSSFKFLIQFGNKLYEEGKYDHLVWLLISKLYLDMEAGPVDYMINIVESTFDIRKRNLPWDLTPASDINSALNETSKKLVREFVSFLGNSISTLMKDAVIGNDLVAMCEEPTSPHPEMRKIVHILTKLEKNVEPIYPDPDSSSFLRSERSSDSSKRSYSTLSGSGNKAVRSPAYSSLDPNMATNINKLFSEKVEIFDEVEFHKSAILMAIVKIGVRALLEYVRLKTMGKFGLHQIQVDVHYLQLYLWRFVNESFLYTLLDEIITSSVQRCVDPVLLESTIVQIIAEKNN